MTKKLSDSQYSPNNYVVIKKVKFSGLFNRFYKDGKFKYSSTPLLIRLFLAFLALVFIIIGFGINNFQNYPIIRLDPLQLISLIESDKDNIRLVDIRLKSQYDQGHLRHAINIPAYQNEDTYKYSTIVNHEVLYKLVKKEVSSRDTIVVYDVFASAVAENLVNYLHHKGYKAYVLSVGWDSIAKAVQNPAGFNLENANFSLIIDLSDPALNGIQIENDTTGGIDSLNP